MMIQALAKRLQVESCYRPWATRLPPAAFRSNFPPSKSSHSLSAQHTPREHFLSSSWCSFGHFSCSLLLFFPSSFSPRWLSSRYLKDSPPALNAGPPNRLTGPNADSELNLAVTASQALLDLFFIPLSKMFRDKSDARK